MHLLLPMRCLQQADKVVHELLAVVLDVLLRILPNQQHLSNVTLALHMTVTISLVPCPSPSPCAINSPFKPILVSHLSLTCLAIPAQPPQAFLSNCQFLSFRYAHPDITHRLEVVADRFRTSGFRTRHFPCQLSRIVGSWMERSEPDRVARMRQLCCLCKRSCDILALLPYALNGPGLRS